MFSLLQNQIGVLGSRSHQALFISTTPHLFFIARQQREKPWRLFTSLLHSDYSQNPTLEINCLIADLDHMVSMTNPRLEPNTNLWVYTSHNP